MAMSVGEEETMSLGGEETGIAIYEKWIVKTLPEIAIALAHWEQMGCSTETLLVLRRVWEAKLAEENANLTRKLTKMASKDTLKAAGIGAVVTVIVAIIAICAKIYLG